MTKQFTSKKTLPDRFPKNINLKTEMKQHFVLPQNSGKAHC